MPEIKRIQRKRQRPAIQFPLWAVFRLNVFPRRDPRFGERLRMYMWALPKQPDTHPIERMFERIQEKL